jgi:hypothetical protein
MTARAHPACNRDAVKALPEAAWLICLRAARLNSPPKFAPRQIEAGVRGRSNGGR